MGIKGPSPPGWAIVWQILWQVERTSWFNTNRAYNVRVLQRAKVELSDDTRKRYYNKGDTVCTMSPGPFEANVHETEYGKMKGEK